MLEKFRKHEIKNKNLEKTQIKFDELYRKYKKLKNNEEKAKVQTFGEGPLTFC